MRKGILFLALLMALVMAAPLVAFTPGAPPGAALVMADLAPVEIAVAASTPKTEAIVASLAPSSANNFETAALPDVYVALRAMLAGLSCLLAALILVNYLKGNMQRVRLADRTLRYARDQCLA